MGLPCGTQKSNEFILQFQKYILFIIYFYFISATVEKLHWFVNIFMKKL